MRVFNFRSYLNCIFFRDNIASSRIIRFYTFDGKSNSGRAHRFIYWIIMHLNRFYQNINSCGI